MQTLTTEQPPSAYRPVTHENRKGRGQAGEVHLVPTSGLINDRKIVLSTVWVFVLINMIYADILGMLKPGYVEDLNQLSQELTGETVLVFSFLMEVPILIILLSRVLKRKANRIVNFIAAPLSILWVIVPALISSLGSTPLSYVFFATVETTAMLFIIWYAYRWSQTDPS